MFRRKPSKLPGLQNLQFLQLSFLFHFPGLAQDSKRKERRLIGAFCPFWYRQSSGSTGMPTHWNCSLFQQTLGQGTAQNSVLEPLQSIQIALYQLDQSGLAWNRLSGNQKSPVTVYLMMFPSVLLRTLDYKTK